MHIVLLPSFWSNLCNGHGLYYVSVNVIVFFLLYTPEAENLNKSVCFYYSQIVLLVLGDPKLKVHCP